MEKLVEVKEEINIPPMTDMQKLAMLKEQIDKLDKDVEELEQAYGINDLKKQKELKQIEFDELIERVSQKVKFSPSNFLKTLKKKGDCYKEGHLWLIRNVRVEREVKTEEFAKAFPDILPKVCKIILKKAEMEIGKNELNKYCDMKETYKYELIDTSKDLE